MMKVLKKMLEIDSQLKKILVGSVVKKKKKNENILEMYYLTI